MTRTQAPRVLVVGGGIAGLVAARSLAGRYQVVLVESEPHPGGKLVTTELRGRPLDVGPDNFITRNTAAERLCRDLGLGDELLAPASSSAAVLSRGRLRPLPAGLVLGVPTDLGALRRSGIVGTGAVLRCAADLIWPASEASRALAARATGGSADPTVAQVVRPRLGDAVLAALVDPLLGGINAGDSDRLSFAAAAPTLAAAAAGERSLLRALRRDRARNAPGGGAAGGVAPGRAGDVVPAGRSGGGAGPGAGMPLFLGLRGGLASLISELERSCWKLGVDIRLGVHADGLERATSPDGPRWVLRCGPTQIEADAVVVAVPAHVAATLLESVSPELSRECAAIPYASVVTVTFAWPESAVPGSVAAMLKPRGPVARRVPPDGSSVLAAKGAYRAGVGLGTAAALPGSGVLVPRSSGHLVTAATFTSTKWPRSANPGEAVVRASAGRDGDDRASLLDDDELAGQLRTELAFILGITAAPLDAVVQRWPASFPQYVSGHLARAERIHTLAGALPGFSMAGAGYGGIGIPACIESGERAADAIDVTLSG